MLDIYTNAFVNDLRNRLAPYGNIPVFGGSTTDQFWQLVNQRSIPIPCVYLHTTFYPGLYQTYVELSQANTWIQRQFDANTYPVDYFIAAQVFAKDPQTVQNFANVIQNIYASGVPYHFQNPWFANERVVLTLKSNPADEAPKELQGYYFQGISLMENNSIPAPCFLLANDSAYIAQNRRIMMEMLAMALLGKKAVVDLPDNATQLKNQYWNNANWICDQLGIPASDATIKDPMKQPREASALFEIFKALNDDDDLSLQSAVQFYLMEAADFDEDSGNSEKKGLFRMGGFLGMGVSGDEFASNVMDGLAARGTMDRETSEAIYNIAKTGMDFLKNRKKQ